MKSLLLISNSTNHGSGYLDHCADEITAFLKPGSKVAFVPYALHDLDGYEKVAKERFEQMGCTLESVHHNEDNLEEFLAGVDAVFIGGGNTFRLLTKLYALNLVELIQKRVEEGMKYIGTSAGTNVATANIKTTNDMPIVYPPSFDALGLVSFNINPHYLDPDPTSTHKGETREQRIKEFHEMNDTVVVGIREGAMLHVEKDQMTLKGHTARVFYPNGEIKEYEVGTDLSDLL